MKKLIVFCYWWVQAHFNPYENEIFTQQEGDFESYLIFKGYYNL